MWESPLLVLLTWAAVCAALRRVPPVKKTAVPKTPMDALNKDNDKYFKYDIMQELPGGWITIGVDTLDGKYGEYPTKTIETKPFLIDKYPVTIAAFRKFLQAKRKYTPRATFVGESYVFNRFISKAYRASASTNYFDEDNKHMVMMQLASWRLPEGPGGPLDRPLESRLLEPVVHVSQADAKAFCNWKKKRLPTELEWEFAARGKLQGKPFPWGENFVHNRSNLWDGPFPKGKHEDGPL